jgi:hypothetical protein
MKVGLWTLIVALTVWTITAPVGGSLAFADVTTVSQTTTSSIQTNVSISSSVNNTVNTSINVAPGPTNQLAAQQQNQGNNQNGADQSQGMGMAAIGAGMAMVAAGMAMMSNPQTQAMGMAMVMAGMALIAAGMAAMQAADKMNNNANQSGQNAGNLSNLTGLAATAPTPDSTNTSTDTGGGTTGGTSLGSNGGQSSGIKIDPALTRTGKIDAIMAKMETQTGIPRDAFVDALNSGVNPLDMLAHAPKLAGNPNATPDKLNSAFNNAKANGLLSANDMMDQIGLSPGDIPSSGEGAYEVAGGASRAPASTNTAAGFDNFFGKQEDVNAGALGDPTKGKISPDVQALLDYKGLSGRTIFDMVRSQYRKKTPQMYGVEKKRGLNSGDNPFSGIGGKRFDL